MKAEAILNKIDEDAKDLSSEILNEAKTKVNQMQINSNKKIADLEAKAQAQVQADANQIRKQMQSISELEFKKEVLQQKRLLIDKSFEEALVKLRNLPLEQIKQKVVEVILDQAEGGQTISIGEVCPQWFNNDVLNSINEKLKAEGKEALTNSGNTVKNCVGAVLSKEGVDTNCTLEALLENIKNYIENDVAAKLFI